MRILICPLRASYQPKKHEAFVSPIVPKDYGLLLKVKYHYHENYICDPLILHILLLLREFYDASKV